MAIKQLTLIGLGLIGGSVARAIKPTRFCETVVAYDNNPTTLQKALAENIIDHAETDLPTAVKNADLILIATPLAQFENILKEIASSAKPDSIITDVGSAKEFVVQIAAQILQQQFSQFVAGHPVAGSEKNGLEASRLDLFANKLVVLTPVPATHAEAMKTIKLFWQQTGARVKIMAPQQHDAIFALTSHLPQLLAYNFMNLMTNQKEYPDIFAYTGGGFKDFTRIAASDAALWKDVCVTNRTAILHEIEQFQQQLNLLKNAIDRKDGKLILEIFANAQKARTAYNAYLSEHFKEQP